METNTKEVVDLLAAQLERLALPAGRPCVTALAIVLGKLCLRFGVEPGEATAVVVLAHCAAVGDQRVN